MNAKMMNRLVMKMGEWFNEQYMMDDMINEQEEEVEGWMMGSVAGRVSLSTRSEDGLMNRDGSGSCWTSLSQDRTRNEDGSMDSTKNNGRLFDMSRIALNCFSGLKGLGFC